MLLISPDSGDIVRANQAASQFYGYPKAHFKKLNISDINMLSTEQVSQELKRADKEQLEFFIFRHQTSGGEVKTVEVYTNPIVIEGQSLLFSIIVDISNQRQLKEELWHYQSNLEQLVDKKVAEIDKTNRQYQLLQVFSIIFLLLIAGILLYLLQRKKQLEEMQYQLAQIVEQSPVSIVTTDLVGHITYINRKFLSESGYTAEDVIGKNPRVLKSGAMNENVYKDLWQTITKGQHWEGDFHNLRASGEIYWERAHVYPLRNKRGIITSYVAIKENITKRKEDEKELRLASTVFQTATEAVMITDANNYIVAVNDAYSEITGYREEEVIGKNPKILSSGHHDKEFYQTMFSELEKNGCWQGEVCNRKKSGEAYYEWLSITQIKDEEGKLEAHVALFSDITKRKKNDDEMYRQANFDALTGLVNRNLFMNLFSQMLELAHRDQRNVALFFIDLDGFKQVNDTLGHAFGDLLLQQVAKRLTESVRKSDTVARLGGDEFAVILSENDHITVIEYIANKIRQVLSTPFMLKGHEVKISACIGIALYPEQGNDVDELLTFADSAMYEAKATGRNKYVVYQDKRQ